MKTLVINMEKDKKRLFKISNQLKAQNIDYYIIKGVVGKDAKKEEVSRLCYAFCTPSMIGCMLSHIRCWEYVVDNDLDMVTILEDDVNLTENFKEKTLDLLKTSRPEDWDIVLLGCFLCKYEGNDPVAKFIMNIGKPMTKAQDEYYNDMLYKPFTWSGTHSYVISKKGAKRLLDFFKKKAYYHVDYAVAHSDVKVLAAIDKLSYQDADSTDSNNAQSIPMLNLLKIDHRGLDIDFILTMPIISIMGFKIHALTIVFLCLFLLSLS